MTEMCGVVVVVVVEGGVVEVVEDEVEVRLRDAKPARQGFSAD